MSYVLGADGSPAKTPTGVAYVSTPTAERDGFASLFVAYKAAYPAGTTQQAFAQELCRVNGLRFRTPDVEAWIQAKGGGRYAFVKSNNPGMYGGPQNVGWGYFREGNVILLPDIPRADGKGPKRPEGPPPAGEREDDKLETASASSTSWWLWGGIGVLVLAIAASRREKKTPRSAAT